LAADIPDVVDPNSDTNNNNNNNNNKKKEVETPLLPGAISGKTPSQKRAYFFKYLIPFLQDRLASILIKDMMASVAGFNDRVMGHLLLDTIAVSGTTPPMTAVDFLLDNLRKSDFEEKVGHWEGYLVPATTDLYTFSVLSDKGPPLPPPPLLLNGSQSLVFSLQQEEPVLLWSTTSPIKLEAGKVHKLELRQIAPANLQWKAKGGSRAAIPSSAFLPGHAEAGLQESFLRLQKLALVVNKFRLQARDVVHINSHREDFDNIDFRRFTVPQWKRLQQYVKLRDSLPPKAELALVDLFSWAAGNPDATSSDDDEQLAAQIARATGWKPARIQEILRHFDFSQRDGSKTRYFRNEVILTRFADVMATSDKAGVDIPRLFTWASPLTTSSADFFKLRDMAEDMQKVARSRYNLKTWPDAIKPVNDGLRENQRAALVSYLLVRDEITSVGIHDADGLFEYFLIDTQMTCSVETSRIKQAIATVQVYIQRCLLGLEEPYGVPTGTLDRQRWSWMQKYRAWEANRKIFLYPENWIDPTLRDDKSDIFRELESQLLSTDLTKETVSAGLKGYVDRVAHISNLSIVGLCVDDTSPARPIHLFAGTRTAPFSYYHNIFREGSWRDWKKMAIEVPHYTVDEGGSGVYFAPIAFQNRVIVFIPQISKKAVAPKIDEGASFTTLGGKVGDTMPGTAWEIKMSWTELRNGHWTPRQLCPDGFVDSAGGSTLGAGSIGAYDFIPARVPPLSSRPGPQIKIMVTKWHVDWANILGEWHFGNGQLTFYGPGSTSQGLNANVALSTFGYKADGALHSAQAVMDGDDRVESKFYSSPPYVIEARPSEGRWGSAVTLPDETGQQQTRQQQQQLLYHTRISDLISASLASYDDDSAIFRYFSSLQPSSTDDVINVFGGSRTASGDWTFNELARPFSLYNWELALHAPMLIIDRLLKSQQFDQALDVCHYIFDPTSKGARDDLTRFWTFLPFKMITEMTIEQMFEAYRPGESM